MPVPEVVASILPQAVVETAQSVAVATSAVGALASPGAALQVQRTLAVLELSSMCGPTLMNSDARHNRELSRSVSPTGWRFGPERGAYYRGAIIGNLMIVGFFALLGGAMVGIGAVFFKKFNVPQERVGTAPLAPPWMRAAGLLRFPSCLIIVVGLTLDGTVSSALAGARHGDDSMKGLDVFLCVLCFVLLAATTGLLWYFAKRSSVIQRLVWLPTAHTVLTTKSQAW